MKKRPQAAGSNKSPERVYVVESGVCIKIGRSRNMRARLFSLRVNNPEPVKVVLMLNCANAVALEARLHWYFRKSKRHGEWFDIPTHLALLQIRGLIEDGTIHATEYHIQKALRVQSHRPAPKDTPEVVNRYCLWCGQGFFTTHPTKVFCDNPNHRIYYSKKRRQQLELWWWAQMRLANFKLTVREAMDTFDQKEATLLAASLGWYYDDDQRRWLPTSIPRLAQVAQSLRVLQPELQTDAVQSAPKRDLGRVHTSDYGTELLALVGQLRQVQSQVATLPTTAGACGTAHSSSDSRTLYIQRENLRHASYRKKADAHAQP